MGTINDASMLDINVKFANTFKATSKFSESRSVPVIRAQPKSVLLRIIVTLIGNIITFPI